MNKSKIFTLIKLLMIIAFINLLITQLSNFLNIFAKEKPIAIASNNKLNPAKTWVFVVGILEWQDSKEFSSFPKKDRRDAKLVDYFKSIGVQTDHIVYLQDKTATTSYIQSSLVKFLKQTSLDDFLFLYYCGHGYKSEEETCFASYDASQKIEGWKVDSIIDSIEKHFRGDRVFLTADCCNSGSLVKAVKERKSNLSYAVLASSDFNETSTGNWTFSDCLLDYFNGEAGADLNNDGQIDLDELATYTKNDLVFGEYQHAQFITTGKFNSKLALSSSSKKKDPRIGKYVKVTVDGKAYPARIIDITSSQVKVHYIGYDKVEDGWVSFSQIKFAKFLNEDSLDQQSYKVGEKVMVEWKGNWYKATIKELKPSSYFIHYQGFGDEWDEWVSPNRISHY